MTQRCLDVVSIPASRGHGPYAALLVSGQPILVRDEGSPASLVIWQRGTEPSAKVRAILDKVCAAA